MSNGSSYIHKIKVESKTLPVGPKSDIAGAKGDATVSPCGGISISMSRDRPNEAIIISAEDVRDDQANFEYKVEGGTYDGTNVYDSLPEGDQTFYVRETNKSCVFEVTKEVIHCDLTFSTTITDEVYDQQDGKIEATANTSSNLYEWKFDGGQWFIGEKTESWAGLNQGTYTVQARDEWGCMVSKDLTVSNVQDTEAPSIPSGLTITDRADGEATVLDWDASTDDERSVSHYRIFRSTTPGFTADSTTLVKDNLTTTTWEDEAVTHGTTYYYRISVVDTSDQANESSASPEKEYIFTDDVAPQPPSGLSGSVSDNTIGLSWTASASPDVEEYVVYVDDGTGPVVDGRTSSTSYSITGLVNEQEHTVRVIAEDEANNQSPFTDAVTKTPIDTTPPAAPTGVSATFSNPDNEVNLSWDPNTEDDFEHYDLYRSTSSGGPYTKINGSEITVEDYTDDTVAIPQTYYYVVEAVDDDDLTSGYSTEVSITTGTVPAAPTGVVATYDESNDKVNLSWDSNSESDLSHYNVYRSTSSGAPYSEVSSSDVTTSSYTDKSVSIAETYYYVIEAVDQDGITSAYSTEATVLTGAPPSAPTGLSASYNGGNGEANVNWDANTDNNLSHYDILRSKSSGGPYSQVNSSDINTESYTDTNISIGKTYYYVVRAIDDDGFISENSNEVSITSTTSVEENFEDYSLNDTVSDFNSSSPFDWDPINSGWFIDDALTGNGNKSLRTNDIGDNTNTEISINLGDNTKQFLVEWTQSNEGKGYDMGSILVDGSLISERGKETSKKDIFEVSDSSSKLKFRYSKDGSISKRQDTFFIHRILSTKVVPPEYQVFQASKRDIVFDDRFPYDGNTSIISGFNVEVDGVKQNSSTISKGSSYTVKSVSGGQKTVTMRYVRNSDGTQDPAGVSKDIEVVSDYSGALLLENLSNGDVASNSVFKTIGSEPTITDNSNINDPNVIQSKNASDSDSESGVEFFRHSPSQETLSIDWAVSSENGYDYIRIIVDGTEDIRKSGVKSGTFTKSLSTGLHHIIIKYTKDGSIDKNEDTAYWGNINIS